MTILFTLKIITLTDFLVREDALEMSRKDFRFALCHQVLVHLKKFQIVEK